MPSNYHDGGMGDLFLSPEFLSSSGGSGIATVNIRTLLVFPHDLQSTVVTLSSMGSSLVTSSITTWSHLLHNDKNIFILYCTF